MWRYHVRCERRVGLLENDRYDVVTWKWKPVRHIVLKNLRDIIDLMCGNYEIKRSNEFEMHRLYKDGVLVI